MGKVLGTAASCFFETVPPASATGVGCTLAGLGTAQAGADCPPLKTAAGLKFGRQSRSLVPGAVWYCAEREVKTVNNPPSAEGRHRH